MEVLDVKELAKFLNCSTSSIRKLVKAQQIPFFRIGSKLNFCKSSIEEWIKIQEHEEEQC